MRWHSQPISTHLRQRRIQALQGSAVPQREERKHVLRHRQALRPPLLLQQVLRRRQRLGIRDKLSRAVRTDVTVDVA